VVFGHLPIHNFPHPGLGSGEGSNAFSRAYHLQNKVMPNEQRLNPSPQSFDKTLKERSFST